MIERDEWLRVRTTSEDRALEFFGYTRDTADVKILDRCKIADKVGANVAIYGVRPQSKQQ